MRYLLYLPGIMILALPLIVATFKARAAARERRENEAKMAAIAEEKRIAAEQKKAERAQRAAEREAARAAREAEQQRKQAARLDYARQLAEYAERALQAKREAREIERAPIILHPSEPAEPAPKPAANVTPAAEPEPPAAKPEPTPEEPRDIAASLRAMGNRAFAGQTVAFTGRLPGMTRREAIQAVRLNGGRAFEGMPAGTTLLVVGENFGMRKMDKADEWIGQVRKITAAQFFAMLQEPLTMELDEFAALLGA